MEILNVNNLHKSFSPKDSLRLDILKIIRRHKVPKSRAAKRHILQGVDFSLQKAERLGIMGRNGCGKSTLLRMLAGIYKPDKGSIEAKGTVSYLPALSAGINRQLTMRDNIYLSGILRGLSRSKITECFDEIVQFSELGDFLDEQVSHFSSGMSSRLAFSTTVHFTLAQNTDILLLDEVFAGGGDKAFKEKALMKFKELFEKQISIIFVSHNKELINNHCTRALILEKGKICFSGSSEEATEKYDELFIKNKHLSRY